MDNGATFAPIPSTSNSITETATQTAQYRAIVEQTPGSNACPDVATASVVVDVSPSVTAQILTTASATCTNFINLEGNALPAGATGNWTIVNSPDPTTTITTAGSLGIVANMNVAGFYSFEWTVDSPAPCGATSAVITIEKLPGAPAANAGVNQTVCTDFVTLSGNNPGNGTASWTFETGPCPVTLTPNGANAVDVSDLTCPGTYEFKYSIDNTPCGVSEDVVVITKIDDSAIADAGPDKTICTSGTVVFGNNPTPGSGTWSIAAAPPTATGANVITVAPSTGVVSGLTVPGTYVLEWEVNNGVCPATTSTMTITRLNNNLNASLVTSSLIVCDTTDAELIANPAVNGTGTWSFVTGPVPATITTNGNTGQVSGMTQNGEYRFRWTVNNACGTSSVDAVIINEEPVIPAFAGADQTICNDQFALVVGNLPFNSNLNGQWSYVTGAAPGAQITTVGGKFGNIAAMTAPGDYFFEYTLSSQFGSCPPSSDVARITRKNPPTTANAGPSVEICGTSATLTGNVPTVGTGVWEYVDGPGSVPAVNQNANVATVSGLLDEGDYTFRYVIENAPCPQSVSNVTVTKFDDTESGVLGGGNVTVCEGDNSGFLNLTGNVGDVLRWEASPDNFSPTTIQIGNTSANLTYTDITTTTTYRALVQNGVCPAEYSNEVTVTVTSAPSTANAGSDQLICGGTTATLNGNVPASGTGSWNFESGPAGVFPNVAPATGSTATVNGLDQPGVYSFSYTIETPGCDPTTDIMVIEVLDAPEGGSVLNDQTVCPGNSGVTLNLTGQNGSVVRWESSTNNFAPGFITTIANNTPILTTGPITATTQYRAVVELGNCPEDFSIPATITLEQTVTANAGPDQTICGSATSADGNNPGANGTGAWSFISGPGGVTPQVTTTGITGTFSGMTAAGVYTFEWEITFPNCPPSSSTMTVTVSPGSNSGVLTATTQTVCAGGTTQLTLSNYNGQILRWESSTGGFAPGTVNTILNTTEVFTAINISQTTQYRVVVKDGTCGETTTNAITIDVAPATVIANAGPDQTVCSSSTVLTGNAPGSGTGTWSYVGGASTNVNVATSVTQGIVTGMDQPGLYVFAYTITNPPCQPSVDNVIIEVVGQPVSGTLTGAATVCAGSNSTTLRLTGATGQILRWESSSPVFGSGPVTTIANTNSNYIVNNLTDTTSFRVILSNPGCGESFTNEVEIAVLQGTNAGAIQGGAAVCSGNNSGALTLANFEGSILRWEFSDNGGNNWTNIANTSATQTYNNLTGDRVYRALVKNGPCDEAYSQTATITVTGASNGGTLIGDHTICSGDDSQTLTLSGYAGNVVRWETSTNNFAGGNITTVSNTNDSYKIFGLTQDIQVRAVVQNSTCAEATSNIIGIRVIPAIDAGTLSSNQTVCRNNNSGTLTLSNFTGDIIRWESSESDFANDTTVINNTTATQAFSNLDTTTTYRVIVGSPTCGEDVSNTVTITVNDQTQAGFVSADQTICNGANTGTLTLNGFVGNVIRWESSTDNFASNIQTIANTTPTQNFTNLTDTTWYRAVVNDGICQDGESQAAKLTVIDPPNAGAITGAASTCGTPASGTLTLSGFTGNIVRWESTTGPDFATGPVSTIANTTATLAYNNVTQTTQYRAIVENAACGEVSSGAVSVIIGTPGVGGTLNNDATVCGGANSGTLNLSGSAGAIVRWESTTGPDFVTGPVDTIQNTATSYTFNNLTETTRFRVVLGSGACPEVFSTEVTVTVSPPLELTVTGGIGCGAADTPTIQATASGGAGGYTYELQPALDAPNQTGTFSNLPTGNYSVVVTDGFGCTATQNITLTNTPIQATISTVTGISQTGATVIWNQVPGAPVIYTLRYRIVGSTIWTEIDNLTNTFFGLANLQPGSNYEVQVTYRCSAEGPRRPFSPSREFRTTRGIATCANSTDSNVPVPGGLFIAQLTISSAEANWSPIPDAAGYIISYGLLSNPPSSWPQFTVCNPDTNFLMTGLTPGSDYGVRIRTNCDNCTTALDPTNKRSQYSVVVEFQTNSIRSAQDGDESLNGLAVYPNPNRGAFTVRFSASERAEATLRMTDVTGREVMRRAVVAETGENQLPVELNGFASGVYLLEFTLGDRKQVVKVVIE